MGSRSVKAPATPAVPVAAQAKEAQVDDSAVMAKERRRGIASTYNRFAAASDTSGKPKLGV